MASSGLQFQHVSKAFGAVRALTGVSFDVRAGESHGIVGENGAGKSTLLKILAGIIRPDSGRLVLDDVPRTFASPREALECGIGMVYQEMLAFPNLSVAGNIFAGREMTRGWGRLDEAGMAARTADLLARLHVPARPDTPMDRLSTAHAQLVQVARAMAFDCHVLVLDEPTTSLTDAEVDHLFGVVETLKAGGMKLAILSNGSPGMLAAATENAAIAGLLDGSRNDGSLQTKALHPELIALSNCFVSVAVKGGCAS